MPTISDIEKGFLRSHIGNQTIKSDDKVFRSLQKSGYLTESGEVTIQGYHAIGLRKHTPFISKPSPRDWAVDAHRHLVIAEKFMIGSRGAMNSDFRISLNDLMAAYVSIIDEANKIIQDTYWCASLDLDAEEYGISQVDVGIYQSMALKRAQSTISQSGHYLDSICVPIARAYLEDRTADFFDASGSMKFAFDDSDWAINALKLKARPKVKMKAAPKTLAPTGIRTLPQSKGMASMEAYMQKAREAVPADLMLHSWS